MRQWRASRGWLILAGFVVAWDWYCDDSLSQGFARGLTRRRPLVIVIWAVTSAHLFHRLPSRCDPFVYASRLKRKRAPC